MRFPSKEISDWTTSDLGGFSLSTENNAIVLSRSFGKLSNLTMLFIWFRDNGSGDVFESHLITVPESVGKAR